MAKTKKPLELTPEQIKIIRLLEREESIDGFIFERTLQGEGNHKLYSQGKLKRNYDLETGEFYGYTTKYNSVFHQPTEVPSQVLPTSRIQFFGRNNFNHVKK